jgi:hypothetical protein
VPTNQVRRHRGFFFASSRISICAGFIAAALLDCAAKGVPEDGYRAAREEMVSRQLAAR